MIVLLLFFFLAFFPILGIHFERYANSHRALMVGAPVHAYISEFEMEQT